jgi:hypothetical protein
MSRQREPRVGEEPADPNQWSMIDLSDLFLDDLFTLATVELVDDPDAIVHVMMHDLLTELLCEV